VETRRAELQDEFLALLTQHRKILYKIAGAYCRSAVDRDDLIAEMTAALWKSFGRYDARRRFSTWMYRIALNVAISHYRSERRRSERLVTADVTTLELPAGFEVDDEQVEQLNRFVTELGDIDKALMLLYLDEHSHKSIATILGLTETNVATKIGRLKAKARAALTARVGAATGDTHGT
jgi:RNA polymerase sigma-70 factor (ECF subfamily)